MTTQQPDLQTATSSQIMTEFNLQSELERVAGAIRSKQQTCFRQTQSERALEINQVLSRPLIEALDIRLLENGSFVFVHNDRRYELAPLKNKKAIVIKRAYHERNVYSDEGLLTFLVEDADRSVKADRKQSIGDRLAFSDGMSLRDYWIGQAISRPFISLASAVSIVDELISCLDAENSKLPDEGRVKFYSFDEVLQWYDPEADDSNDLPF